MYKSAEESFLQELRPLIHALYKNGFEPDFNVLAHFSKWRSTPSQIQTMKPGMYFMHLLDEVIAEADGAALNTLTKETDHDACKNIERLYVRFVINKHNHLIQKA